MIPELVLLNGVLPAGSGIPVDKPSTELIEVASLDECIVYARVEEGSQSRLLPTTGQGDHEIWYSPNTVVPKARKPCLSLRSNPTCRANSKEGVQTL